MIMFVNWGVLFWKINQIILCVFFFCFFLWFPVQLDVDHSQPDASRPEVPTASSFVITLFFMKSDIYLMCGSLVVVLVPDRSPSLETVHVGRQSRASFLIDHTSNLHSTIIVPWFLQWHSFKSGWHFQTSATGNTLYSGHPWGTAQKIV